MFSLQRHKSHSRRFFSFAVFGLLLLLGIVVITRPAFLTRLSLSIGTPFMQLRAAVGDSAGSLTGFFSSKRTLIQENTKLREQLALEKVKGKLFDDMRADYEDLRNLTKSNETRIPARVIASPSVVPYDVLVIDVGSMDGVLKDDLIYAGTSALLGRIATVGGKTSRAVLFSSPTHEERLIHLSSGTPVDAVGQGGGSFVVSIPQDIEVEVGDALTLPEAPHGVVAFVTRIDASPSDAFQSVHAALPENIYTLRHVGVGGHLPLLQ